MQNKVRLDNQDIENIKTSFLKYFGKDDHLWIFGSRVDLTKRGGDIDLYIEVKDYSTPTVLSSKSDFWIDLQDKLGEQKIDIVIKNPGQNLSIYDVARQNGVKIV
jgi:hypothetical protein